MPINSFRLALKGTPCESFATINMTIDKNITKQGHSEIYHNEIYFEWQNEIFLQKQMNIRKAQNLT